MAPPLRKQDSWRTQAIRTWRRRLSKVRTLTRLQRALLSQSPTLLMRMVFEQQAHICQWRRRYLMQFSSRWIWSLEHSQGQAQIWECTRNKGITGNTIDTKFHLRVSGFLYLYNEVTLLDSLLFVDYLTTPSQLHSLCSVEWSWPILR